MGYIIGVESTAHTFGVSVVNKSGKIFSNEKSTYTTKSGGMIPLEVRNHHKRFAPKVYKKALSVARISEREIEAVAFSNAPGLAPCLLEGMAFVKKISSRLNVPVVGVNHCIAHLEIGEITGAKDPVLLYVSGANTQVIAYEAGKYRVFGETLDLGVGNFIDTFARFMGIGFPGGPIIQKLAEEWQGGLIELPYSVKGMDVSFSGLQTKLKSLIEKGYDPRALSYAMQETVFAMLLEVSERAIAHTGKNEFLLGGGVACNTRLQDMAKKMCEERKVRFFCPDSSFLVDNAAMIAYLGMKMFKCGLSQNPKELDIFPRQRTDEVRVVWR